MSKLKQLYDDTNKNRGGQAIAVVIFATVYLLGLPSHYKYIVESKKKNPAWCQVLCMFWWSDGDSTHLRRARNFTIGNKLPSEGFLASCH